MPETSVKDQVKKLVDLQLVDNEIYSLKIELKEKPEQLEILKNEFEATKAHLHELEEKLKHVQVSRKEKELDLKSKEDEIAKANTVLSQLKTNKEYTAKVSEIESIKADKSVLEEKILESFDEADAVTKEIEAEKKKVAEEEKGYLAQKSEVDDRIKEIEGQLKSLETKRQEKIPGIDKTYLARYEKILPYKEGLAVAKVNVSSCSGCYMNVTPQMVNVIKMGEELVVCESCQRILYIEEDL